MCCRPSAAAIAARDQSPRQFASPGHGAQRWILAQSSLETCALEPGILRSTADTAGTSRPRLGRRGAQRYARRARHGRPPVGKSTLTTVIAEHDHPARLVTLDDRATRAAALADRTGFVAGFDGNVVIDEVQRAPDLLLAIKEVVDRERRPGRFLLTVAALASRKSAGRAATSSTRSMRRPLRRSRTPHRSRGVRRARRRRRLSRGSPARGTPQADLVSRRRRFHARPRSARRLRRAQARRRSAPAATARHPVRGLAQLQGRRHPPATAPRHDQELHPAAGDRLPRQAAPRLAPRARCARRPHPQTAPRRDGRDEIDIVLENRAGEIAAIEVKAGASLDPRDWRALAKLRDRADKRFRAGVLIHAGRQTLPLGDHLWALPISGLWA